METITQQRAKNLAYDNTYGKGINPESVEKMKEILDELVDVFSEDTNDSYILAKATQLSIRAKEALTASKL